MDKKTKILIVDDSPLVRNILKDIFAEDPQLEVIGEACNGKEAIQMVSQLKPDIITMDIQMPEMDGFEATEYIMAYTPTPILILSSAIDKSEQYSSFKAIALGALDNMSKPDITREGFAEVAQDLVRKVKMLSNIRVIPHIRGKLKGRNGNGSGHKPPDVEFTDAADESPDESIRQLLKRFDEKKTPEERRYKTVVVGTSTGGPMALEKILSLFPSDFPAGIVIVQHMAKGFIDSFAEWLGNKIRLNVKIAENDEPVLAGTVYFSPDDVQMEITPENFIHLNKRAPHWGEFKPSVNHLFKSAADNLGGKVIGVILTGMGSDGALGMGHLHQCGAYTIAQDQESSLIFGMPKAAIDNRCVHSVLPLSRIAEEIFIKIEE